MTEEGKSGRFYQRSVRSDCRAAFRARGLDTEADDPAAPAARIAGSPIRAEFREAVRHDPNLVPAHFNLKGDRPGAIAAYHAVIRLEPRESAAHNNLGRLLDQAGNLDAAIDCYRRRCGPTRPTRPPAGTWRPPCGGPSGPPRRRARSGGSR